MIWISVGENVDVGIKEGDQMMDSEGVFVWEPLGYSFFSFTPKRCRNGRVRWFTWLQKHQNGTYTKCNLG